MYALPCCAGPCRATLEFAGAACPMPEEKAEPFEPAALYALLLGRPGPGAVGRGEEGVE